MKQTTGFRCGIAFLLTVLLNAVPASHAAWTSNSLPNLATNFGSYRMAHLTDGRLVYATNDDLDRQNSFNGAFGLSDYTAIIAPNTWDPSSVALFSDTLGAIGAGTFGPSGIYLFNPSNLATAFTAVPSLSLQNYSLVFRDATSLYVGGGNGTGGKHAISYVTTDGATNKIIIDNISTFSADFAIDLAGNLYVSDNDDRRLYKFTPAQLTAAIAGPALSITDGTYITTTAKNGSIAIDGLGRIWTTGYQSNGLDLYDPATGGSATFVPGLANSDYIVSTFTAGGESYVAYLNASGFDAGDAVNYGYEKSTALVPEPGSAALVLLGFTSWAAARRRQQC